VRAYLSALFFFIVIFFVGSYFESAIYSETGTTQVVGGGNGIPKVGDLVPDFELPDLNGKLIRLSSLRGNYVFLNFWATWCLPCLEELPSMDALNQRWKAKPITMLAVSVDETKEAITNFLGRLNRAPSFLILQNPDHSVATKYGTEKFPESFWIDPNGVLIAHYIGAENWAVEEQIRQLEVAIKPLKEQ